MTSVLQTTAGKMIFGRWPEASAFDETPRHGVRVGERRDGRPRDLRPPERREGERFDRVGPAPTPLPMAVPVEAVTGDPDLHPLVTGVPGGAVATAAVVSTLAPIPDHVAKPE